MKSIHRVYGVVLSALLVVTTAESAIAGGYCADLDAAKTARYQELVGAYAEAYGEKKFDRAIELILEARGICGEDPLLAVNLGKIYGKSGNCERAGYWYEEVTAWKNDRVAAGLEVDAPLEKAAGRAAELKETLVSDCTTRGDLEITCAQVDAALFVNDEEVSCPYAAKVPVGPLSVRATLDGHAPWEQSVDIGANAKNKISVPALERLATTGVVNIACPASEGTEFSVVDPGGNEREEVCPTSLELEPGGYSFAMHGQILPAAVVAGETLTVNFTQAGPNLIGVYLDLRVTPGSGWAEGTVYDKNNEIDIANLSGTQPTQFTFAIVNEIGYIVNDWLKLGVYSRFEVANFSALVGAVARFVPYQNSWLSVRASLMGGGGGLNRPVEIEDGVGLVRMGPGFAGASLGLGFHINELFAIVFDVETKVGFPDFGVHLDWASAGGEVTF